MRDTVVADDEDLDAALVPAGTRRDGCPPWPGPAAASSRAALRHGCAMASPTSRRRASGTSLAALVLALAPPGVGAAQATLVVPVEPEPSRGLEAVVDDVLRDHLDGSVRRVDLSMDDLALAAGCRASALEPECVEAIAAAAGVRIVALERISRDAGRWRIVLDLRRADGTRIRAVSAPCDAPDACGAALAAAFGDEAREVAEPREVGVTASAPASTRAAVTPAPRGDRARAAAVPMTDPVPAALDVPATPADPDRRGPSSTAIMGGLLFGGAAILGVGAAIAGGLALDFAGDAAGLGQLETEREVDRVRSLEDRSAVSLGVGIALCVAGAALAIAGTVTVTGGAGPVARVRAVASPAGLFLSLSL